MNESTYRSLLEGAACSVEDAEADSCVLPDSRVLAAATNAYYDDDSADAFEDYGILSMTGHANASDGGNGEYCRWQFTQHRMPSGDWSTAHPTFTLPCALKCDGFFMGRLGAEAMKRFGECAHSSELEYNPLPGRCTSGASEASLRWQRPWMTS